MEGASATEAQRNAGGSGRPRNESAGSRPPCRFFVLGKCKFGESCTFSHEPCGRVPVCRFFEKNGNCRYGKDCKFLHGTLGTNDSSGTSRNRAGAGRNASSAAIDYSATVTLAGASEAGAGGGGRAQVADGGRELAGEVAGEGVIELDDGDNCGICLENIPASGKRFGLMNCDHVYCLECLRTWRKSKGPQKDISRTCPECRKVSFFLVPSKEHLKGKEKVKAIQEYKKGLSKLPCKYHKADGSNSCPFGSKCFYAHLDETGVDVKDRAAPPAAAAPRRACPYMQRNGVPAGGARSSAGRGGRGGRSRVPIGTQPTFAAIAAIPMGRFQSDAEWGDIAEFERIGERMRLDHLTFIAEISQLERELELRRGRGP